MANKIREQLGSWLMSLSSHQTTTNNPEAPFLSRKQAHKNLRNEGSQQQTRLESGTDRQVPTAINEVSEEQCGDQKQGPVACQPAFHAQEEDHLFRRHCNPTGTFFSQGHLHRPNPGSPLLIRVLQIKTDPPSETHVFRRRWRTRFCYWVGKPPELCDPFRRLRRPGCLQPDWRKWASFLNCTSVRARTDSSKKGSNPIESNGIDSDTNEVGRSRGGGLEEEEEDQEFVVEGSSGRIYGSGASTSPPKNGLLLTRCRSAPHRSSYLASRFWGSPLKIEEAEAGETGEQENRENTTVEEDEREEGNLGICKEGVEEAEEFGGSNGSDTTKINPETEKAIEGEKQREREASEVEGPVVLTRCKSDPARSSGDPLTSSFWSERRWGSTVS